MIKILALDISSHAGYAVVEVEGEEKKLIGYGIVEKKAGVKEYGPYPWSYLEVANEVANALMDLVQEHNPDVVVIEETNLGKNRYAQKLLEFIHATFLELASNRLTHNQVVYISSSAWRSALGLQMTKEQKKANAKLAKAKKEAQASGAKLDKKALGVRGKVTKKHLAVEHANKVFDLKLKVKDNDIADAICLALAHLAGAEQCDGIL